MDTTLRTQIAWYNIWAVHNIAGPLVPYNHACPKPGSIHRDRVIQYMKQALYLQATTAGLEFQSKHNQFQRLIGKWSSDHMIIFSPFLLSQIIIMRTSQVSKIFLFLIIVLNCYHTYSKRKPKIQNYVGLWTFLPGPTNIKGSFIKVPW